VPHIIAEAAEHADILRETIDGQKTMGWRRPKGVH